jgi:MoCo/4Fe-4S cofactor protein with predicted Tat translocation signal
MSNVHQCPSSETDGLSPTPQRTPHELVGASGGLAGGAKYWRSLDDLADTTQFREFLDKEFPAGASELLAGSRRTFLKLMGAGLALAGVASMPGCRQPDHKILPYSRTVPEDIIPGRPLFYATSMPLPGGGAEGLLVESHEGRPTKIEGNPLHPVNQGKSSLWSQAAILSLYDPDRVKEISLDLEGRSTSGNPAEIAAAQAVPPGTFAQFMRQTRDKFSGGAHAGGKGLAVLVERQTSVTRDALRQELLKKYPQAQWVVYDPIDNANVVDGSVIAFGDPGAGRAVYALDKANVVLSLDADFLQFESGSLKLAREWGASRRVIDKPQGGRPVSMTRLYSIESQFSITGASADHRLRLAPSQVGAALIEIAKALGGAAAAATGGVNASPAGLKREFIDAIVADFKSPANAGKALVVVGTQQPAWVHALAHAINAQLGSIGEGKPVGFLPWTPDERAKGVAGIKALSAAMAKGEIDTLFVLGGNPVFDAPADSGFAEAFAKVPTRVTLANEYNETLVPSTWRLPMATFLEAWGDTLAYDGTLAPVQPLIAPLYQHNLSEIEVLAMLVGREQWSGYEVVRSVWREALPKLGVKFADFETLWRRSLHDGVVAAYVPARPGSRAVLTDAVANSVRGAKLEGAPSEQQLDVAFVAGAMRDGRWNNNAWLQELPEPISKIVWDNAALISPATANALGLMQTDPTDKKPSGRVCELNIGGKSVRLVAWAVPGVADNTVVVALGYGRRRVGLVGQGTGFDVYPLRTGESMWISRGSLRPTEDGERYQVSVTQHHGSMHGRAIVREIDLQAWNDEDNHKAASEDRKDSYKRRFGQFMDLTFAERLEGSDFNHMPAPVPNYVNPLTDKAQGYSPAKAHSPGTPGSPAFDRGPQWAMTIDQSACTGCNVCTIACQAENNIPVVGKIEVQKGREMHWIRVDRYFKGNVDDPEGAVFQPMACVHCEDAPCEVVCPVNATVHGPEGHNYMVYNRCIGTRYCANNCPWKVRRFNFFDYGVTKFNGNYFGQDALEGALPGFLATSETTPHRLNPNLIPPRLRAKLDEISRMQKNPNVTVRSRGVMEKCSYCIQRTNEAKITLKLERQKAAKLAQQKDGDPVPVAAWRPEDGLPDLFVQTACQQACPTNAITFGDRLDNRSNNGQGSLVRQLRSHGRSYLVLGFLGTRPRTSHLARMNNPSELLSSAERKKSWSDPFGHEHHAPGAAPGHGVPGGDKGHAGAGAPAGAASYVEASKVGRDGYKLSLSVLGATSGSMA